MATFLMVLLTIVSAFLMFVVLIQRGRGGGLAGAFGGQGGQSAFGTKAGDLFTWITVWGGILWVVLAILTGWRYRVENGDFFGNRAGTTEPSVTAAPGGTAVDEGKSPADNDKKEGDAGVPASALPRGKAEKGDAAKKDAPAKDSAQPAAKNSDAAKPDALQPEPKTSAAPAPGKEGAAAKSAADTKGSTSAPSLPPAPTTSSAGKSEGKK